jgi:hypothetical protein
MTPRHIAAQALLVHPIATSAADRRRFFSTIARFAIFG